MGDRLAESEPTDRRERQADAREAAADRREQDDDIREGVLDGWERELVARAIELDMFDELDAAAIRAARQDRADAHQRRRADAELRHDAAVGRGVQRSRHRGATAPEVALGRDAERAIERLAALVDSDSTLTDTLTAILAIAVDALAGAAAATACLTVDGKLQHAASTAPWAVRLDGAQLHAGAGPILEAIETGAPVVASDLAGDDRWELAASVGADGSRCVLSAPIAAGTAPSGALTVYAAPGVSFDDRAALAAAMLSANASLAVRRSLERRAHEAKTEAWVRALASRDLIGQAKGILMAQQGLIAEAAFDLLRSTSQRRNVKVRDIAEYVAIHRRLPDEPAT